MNSFKDTRWLLGNEGLNLRNPIVSNINIILQPYDCSFHGRTSQKLQILAPYFQAITMMHIVRIPQTQHHRNSKCYL